VLENLRRMLNMILKPPRLKPMDPVPHDVFVNVAPFALWDAPHGIAEIIAPSLLFQTEPSVPDSPQRECIYRVGELVERFELDMEERTGCVKPGGVDLETIPEHVTTEFDYLALGGKVVPTINHILVAHGARA
jgi:hypothetical protein